MELDQQKIELKNALDENHDFTVVCIDDVESILNLHAEMMKSTGLKVFASVHANEVLDFIQKNQHKIVFILSDLKMPEMDGLELRTKLLEIAPSVPFVLLSANIDKDLAIRGIELKISAFLSKPLRRQDLADLIRTEVIPRISVLKDDEEMLVGFAGEAGDLVEASERHLLELEHNPNSLEAINSLFGCIHTLKGSSSFFHPKTLHKFIHRYEDFLKKLQKGELKPRPDLISAFLSGLDAIKFLLHDLKHHEARAFDVEAQIEGYFGAACSQNTATPATTAALDAPAATQAAKHEPNEVRTEIRVPLTTLDEFMRLSGEMTVIRSMLNKCVTVIEKHYADDKDVNNLSELLQELHKINTGVQDKISDLRKVLVRTTLNP